VALELAREADAAAAQDAGEDGRVLGDPGVLGRLDFAQRTEQSTFQVVACGKKLS
jgi:hypothetical protein